MNDCSLSKWILTVLCGLVILSQPDGAGAKEVDHKPDQARYQSAEECRRCHSDIHRIWTNSMHAIAATDPFFLASLRRAENSYGNGTREFCLSCHSPTTQVTKDFELNQPISREGVTCDFCHTVTGVTEKTPQNLFSVQLGNTKFGPFEGLQPIENLKFQYSALHKEAVLCSGCHELHSASGVHILGTYSEWKESPYAKQGIQCRHCHMPELMGVPAVNPDVRPTSPVAHAHEFLGGHSRIRLETAASLVISCNQENGSVLVDAFVTNEEAGHWLPTGIPVRKILLTVALKDSEGTVLDTRTHEYRKIVVNDEGVPLEDPEKVIMEAAAVRTDNRIKPKETRVEKFEFRGMKVEGPYIVSADLRYYFSMDTNALSVPLASAERSLPREIRGSAGHWLVLILVSGTLLAILYLIVTHTPVHKRR